MRARGWAACRMQVCALLMGGVMSVSAWAVEPAAPAASAASAPVSQAAPQSRLEDYYLLALSPSEGVAVLRGPDRRLVTLRVGTALPSAKARLTQVLGDRLRFDTLDDQGNRQSAWMIRAANPEQLPEVQRVSGVMPAPPTTTPSGQVTAPLSSPKTTK
jgi:hypothetical protein